MVDWGAVEEIIAGAFESERVETRRLIAEALSGHVEGEDHRRPRGLVDPLWSWDSGVEGTPLTAMPTHPGGGYFHVWFPSQIHAWSVQGGPTGTATWLVKVAGPDAVLTAAATVLTCGLTAPESSSDAFEPITVAAGSRVAAYLTVVGGAIEWTGVNLELRRT